MARVGEGPEGQEPPERSGRKLQELAGSGCLHCSALLHVFVQRLLLAKISSPSVRLPGCCASVEVA
eukprot:312200-Alexandrium_andersonii.AAC.1